MGVFLPEYIYIYNVFELQKYYVGLAKQLGPKRKFKTVGENLSPDLLDNFNEEQIGQLKELLEATVSPPSQESGTEEKR